MQKGHFFDVIVKEMLFLLKKIWSISFFSLLLCRECNKTQYLLTKQF